MNTNQKNNFLLLTKSSDAMNQDSEAFSLILLALLALFLLSPTLRAQSNENSAPDEASIADRFDYPFGNRGYANNSPIPIDEKFYEPNVCTLLHRRTEALNKTERALLNAATPSPVNTFYNLEYGVEKNHGRDNSGEGCRNWFNISDVGNHVANFGLHPGEDWHNHDGRTYESDAGEAIYSIANGTITSISHTNGAIAEWGWSVTISHTLPDDSIVTSVYSHLSSPHRTLDRNEIDNTDGLLNFPSYLGLEVGDIVTRGQLIGRLGRINPSGYDTNAHLHLEIRQGDYTYDRLYRTANSHGYYTHNSRADNGTITASRVIETFKVMKNANILDPSDFIDAHRDIRHWTSLDSNIFDGSFEAIRARLTNYSPKKIPPSVPFKLTLEGVNLPTSIAVSVKGGEFSCILSHYGQSRVVMECPALTPGERELYIKDKPNGRYIKTNPESKPKINVVASASDAAKTGAAYYYPSATLINKATEVVVHGYNLNQAGDLNAYLVSDTAKSGTHSLLKANYQNCKKGNTTSDKATFICTPKFSGVNKFLLKDEASGNSLKGTRDWTIFVRERAPLAADYFPKEVQYNTPFTLTISGNDLPASLHTAFSGHPRCEQIPPFKTNLVKFRCPAITSSKQKLIIKSNSQSLGQVAGSENWHISVKQPVSQSNASNFTPEFATEKTRVTVTVSGKNFPSSAVVNIEGSPTCEKSASTTTERLVFVCTPQETGLKRVFVKNYSNANSFIPGSENFKIQVNPLPSPPIITKILTDRTNMSTGQSFQLGMQGQNLPQTLVANIEGHPSHCVPLSLKETSAVFKCSSDIAGKRNVYIKDRPNGTIVQGSENFTVWIHEPIPEPSVSSFSPPSTPLGQPFSLVINGSHLPSSLVANIQGSNSCSQSSYSSAQVRFDCTPLVAGRQRVYVKDKPDGGHITGSLGFYIDITAAQSQPYASSFSPKEARVLQDVDVVVRGRDFPSTAVVNIHGSLSDCTPRYRSATELEFRCTPNETGLQSVYVKDRSGGNFISGSTSFKINVYHWANATGKTTEPATVRSGQSFKLGIQASSLPNTVVASIEGSSSPCSLLGVNSNGAVFQCISYSTGSKKVFLRDRTGGSLIRGSENYTVYVNP